MPDRSNPRLNAVIERFLDAYDGTAIGRDVRNMYENGTGYETICDYLSIDIAEYQD